MNAIKQAYITKQINAVTAAKKLTAHNGNGLSNNLTIIKAWR